MAVWRQEQAARGVCGRAGFHRIRSPRGAIFDRLRRLSVMKLPLMFTVFVALSLGSCASTRTLIPSTAPNLPFSGAVQVGDMLYVSGHLGLDPETRQAPEDAEREAELVLDAVAATLGKADMTMDDLVQVQIFCTDLSLYETFNEVYRERFSAGFPARAFIGTSDLLRGCHFEVLGIAARR